MAADEPSDQHKEPELARTMGLAALIVYGVGDMLGAGIYGLIGKAAGLMGNAVWLAFAGAMVAALLTGLSYASLGSRYPRAAGAAFVTRHAYRSSFLAYVVGLTVAASGLTSMATGSRVIAGYLQGFGVAVSAELLAVGFLVLLAGLVFRGMRESTWANVLCTTVELGGLLIVIVVGARYWGSVNYLEVPAQPHAEGGLAVAFLVVNGAVLTFFSFIGFEDILNVAEEVKHPRRTIPLGLILALLIATLIYMAVSITAVSVMPHAELAASKAPLVDVVSRAQPGFPRWVFGAIAIFAVANTALLNYVMGSRLLYGMARQGLLPRLLGRVHAGRRTPHVAIVALLCVVVMLALVGGVRQLADATALLLLGVFAIVNFALVVLKLRKDEPKGAFEVPLVIPALGALVCLALVGFRVLGPGTSSKAPLTALAIVGIIMVLYLARRARQPSQRSGEG